MNKLLTSRITKILLLLFVLFSCDKDVEVIDGFDFKLIETHISKGFIFERNQSDFKIQVPQKVSSTVYNFSFETIEGDGVFETSYGKEIKEGEKYELKDYDWRMNYLSTEAGPNKVRVVVEDNKGFSDEVIMDFEIAYAPFTFLISPKSSNYIINGENPIEITLFRDSEIKAEDSFTFNYFVENGTAQLIEIDSLTAKKSVLKQGEKNEIDLGTNSFNYLPTTLGKHILNATAVAPDGAKRDAELELDVRHLNFDFTTTAESNQVAINEPYDLTVNFTNEQIENDVTYQMMFEYGMQSKGVVRLKNEKGQEIAAGNRFKIVPDAYTWSFTSQDVGRKNLMFTIIDSNGQEKKDSVIIDVETIPIVFKGSAQNNTVFINQPTTFNFELTPKGDPKDVIYNLSYNLSQGNGILKNADGEVLKGGVNYRVEPGAFSYIYQPTTLGTHDFVFKVEDSNGQEVGVNIKLLSKNIDLNFMASAAQSTMVLGNTSNINVSLIENGDYKDVSYELSYFITGGTAALLDGEKVINPSQYKSFKKGSTDFTFKPELPGSYDITFLLRDSNGQILERTVSIAVSSTDFVFKAVEQSSKMALGGSMPINFSVTPNTQENEATYEMVFEKTLGGTLVIDGQPIMPGQKLKLNILDFKGEYKPDETGTHQLNFTVTDSQGVSHKDDVVIEVANGDYMFSATSSPSKIIMNETANINFDISQTVINPKATYEIAFELEGPNATVMDSNGTVIEPGVFMPIKLGATTWSFTTPNDGAYSLDFSVRDNTGVIRSDNVLFEVDANSFEFTAEPEALQANVFENIRVYMEIEESAVNSGDTYELRFATNVEGHIFDADGNSYTPGQAIKVPTGKFYLDYKGLKHGDHSISFTVSSSSKASVTKDIVLTYNQISYEFIASPRQETMYKGSSSDLIFNINEGSSGSSTYRMRYSLSGINGNVYNEHGDVLQPGTYYDVPSGNFNWTLDAFTSGIADLEFVVVNASELEKTAGYTINVLEGDYTLEAYAAYSNREVPEVTPIDIVIGEFGQSQAPYGLSFSSSFEGTLEVNGQSIAAGQTVNISGTTTVNYTGMETGLHNIDFTVVSSTGQRKSANVTIDYNGGMYDFTAYADRVSIYRGGVVNIDFEVIEQSNPSNYTMSYVISGGNSIIKNEQGNEVSGGIRNQIKPNEPFTWTFSSDNVGIYTLEFTVINAAGLSKTVPIEITVKEEDYVFEAIGEKKNAEVFELVGLNLNFTEQTGIAKIPYTVSYSNTSGLDGVLIVDGVEYAPGSEFELSSSKRVLYKGNVSGIHNLDFTVVSTTGNRKTDQVSFDVQSGVFVFNASMNTKDMFRGEELPLIISLEEQSIKENEYEFRYSIVGGSGGKLLDENGVDILQGMPIKVDVEQNYNWAFTTEVEGDYVLNLEVRSSSGNIKTKSFEISVKEEDYVFEVIGEKKNVEVFELVGVNLNFIDETGIPKIPYTVSYSNASGLDGVLIVDGVEYAPGSEFELSSSKHVLYKGNVSGIHNLNFSAVSTTGNRKTDQVSFDVQSGAFVFNASMNTKDMFRGEELSLIISLQELSANENEYEFRYTIVGGSGGKLLDENGVDILQGMPIKVDVDQNYNWAFTTEVEGDYVLNLEVRSSSGNIKTKSFDITVKEEDFNLDATLQDPSLEVNQKAGFNLSISNVGLSRGPYKVSYKSNLKGKLWIGNDSYQPGDIIHIDSEGTYSMLYEGSEEGVHNIEIIAFNSKGKMKSDSFDVEFIAGDFSLSVAADKNIVYRLEQSAFNFIIRELSQVPSESYTLTYAVLSESNLKITQNGEARNAGVPYSVPVNESFKWDFMAEIDGEVTIEFTARNAEGVERKAQVTINVDEEDFEFKVIPSTKQAKVLEDLVDLTFKIVEAGVFEDDYEVYYETDRDIILSFNGVAYGPGSSFEIKNDAVATLRGMTVGTTYITFHAVPKNGGAEAKEFVLDIEFTGSNFEFNAGGFDPNSIYKDETSKMNFQILETGGTSSYQMIVDFLNGSGVFYDANGVEVPRGIWIDVEKGSFNWTFKGTEVHDNVRVRIRARNTLDLEFEYFDEIEVKKTDFDFTATKTEDNIVVYSPVDVNFNISKKGVEPIDYTMFFNVSNGNGVLESLDGTKVYTPGQPITVNEGNFTFRYRGNSVGKHNINFTVNADNGVSHSDSESISFKQIDFNLNATVNPTAVYEGEEAMFNITGTEIEGGNDTYELMYQITSSGISGKFYKGAKLLAPTTYYPITGDGNFSEQWKFVADDNITLNKSVVTVKFIAKNTSGVVKEVTRNIDVLKTNFTFSATVDGSNEKFVNKTIPIDFNITKQGTKPISYTMYYTSSAAGELTVGGTTYGSNEAIPVTAGAPFKGVYKGLEKGNHNVTFKVVASNGVEKQDLVGMVYREIDFSLSGDVNPTTIYERESTTIRVNGQEISGGNDTYTMSYVITGGTGTIKNGSTTLDPNKPYNVGKGNFISNWVFTAGDVPAASNKQDVTVTLTVKNTSGVIKTAVRKITVNKTNFNFSANVLDNEAVYPGQEKPITFKIDKLGTKPLTYQMRYATNGNGKLIYKGTERPANTWFTVSEGNFTANYKGDAVGNHKLDFVVRANNSIEKSDNLTIKYSEVGMTFTGYANTEMYVTTTEDLNLNIAPDVELPGVTYQVKFEFSQGDPQDAIIKDQNGNIVSPNTQWVTVPSGDFKWTVKGNKVGNIRLNFSVRNSTDFSKEEQIDNPIAIKVLESPIDFEFEVNYSMTEPPSGGGGGGFIPDPEAPGDGGIDDDIIFVPMPIKTGVIYEKIPLVFTIEPGQNTIENQTYTMRAIIPSSHDGVIIYNGVTYQSGQKFEVSESEFEAEYRGFTKGTHNIKFTVEGTGDITGSTKEISDNIELTYSGIDFEKLEIIDMYGDHYNPPIPKYKNDPFPLNLNLYMNPDYKDVRDYIDFTMTFSVSGNDGVITYEGQDYAQGEIIPLEKGGVNPTVFISYMKFTAKTDNDFRITYNLRNNLTNEVVTASKDIILDKAPLLVAKGGNRNYGSGKTINENIIHIWYPGDGERTQAYGTATIKSVHIKTYNRNNPGVPVNYTYNINNWFQWENGVFSPAISNGGYAAENKGTGKMAGKYLVFDNWDYPSNARHTGMPFEVYIVDSNGKKSNVVKGIFEKGNY